MGPICSWRSILAVRDIRRTVQNSYGRQIWPWKGNCECFPRSLGRRLGRRRHQIGWVLGQVVELWYRCMFLAPSVVGWTKEPISQWAECSSPSAQWQSWRLQVLSRASPALIAPQLPGSKTVLELLCLRWLTPLPTHFEWCWICWSRITIGSIILRTVRPHISPECSAFLAEGFRESFDNSKQTRDMLASLKSGVFHQRSSRTTHHWAQADPRSRIHKRSNCTAAHSPSWVQFSRHGFHRPPTVAKWCLYGACCQASWPTTVAIGNTVSASTEPYLAHFRPHHRLFCRLDIISLISKAAPSPQSHWPLRWE